MPKKFAGENSKAAAAKARKAEKAEAENLKKEKEREDAEWRDDDKSLKKKQVGVDKGMGYLSTGAFGSVIRRYKVRISVIRFYKI